MSLIGSGYSAMYKLLAGSLGLFTISNYYKGSEKFYDEILMPLMNTLGSDNVHRLALIANKYKLVPKCTYQDPTILNVVPRRSRSLNLSNPLGVAADFDANGESLDGLFNVGYGFIEVKSDQYIYEDAGDSSNWLFSWFMPRRQAALLEDDDSIILNKIKSLRENPEFNGIIGVNLNSHNIKKYTLNTFKSGVKKYGTVADYLVIEYEQLVQSHIQVEKAIKNLKSVRDKLPNEKRPLLFIKLPADSTPKERKHLAAIVNQPKYRLDGIIVPINEQIVGVSSIIDSNPYNPRWRNTSTATGPNRRIESVNTVSDMYGLTNGQTLIIGDGHISTGLEAYEQIKAGASFLQIYYPVLLQHGPPRITRIKKDLEKYLTADGYSNISEAVGVEYKKEKVSRHFFPFYY